MKNIDEHDRVEALISIREVQAIESAHWYQRLRTRKQIGSFDRESGTPRKNLMVDESVATSYVEQRGGFLRKQFR